MTAFLRVDHDGDEVARIIRRERQRVVCSVQPPAAERLDADAVREKVASALHTYDFSHVFAGGHGLADRIDGHDARPLWDCDSDLGALRGLSVHLLCCHTARQLGPAMHSHGVRSFWGYDNLLFVFPLGGHTPEQLTHAVERMLETSLQVELGLLDGQDREAILERVLAHYAKVVNELSPGARTLLLANLRALRCIEDGETHSLPLP